MFTIQRRFTVLGTRLNIDHWYRIYTGTYKESNYKSSKSADSKKQPLQLQINIPQHQSSAKECFTCTIFRRSKAEHYYFIMITRPQLGFSKKYAYTHTWPIITVIKLPLQSGHYAFPTEGSECVAVFSSVRRKPSLTNDYRNLYCKSVNLSKETGRVVCTFYKHLICILWASLRLLFIPGLFIGIYQGILQNEQFDLT